MQINIDVLEFISGLVMDGFLPVFVTLIGFLPTVVLLLTIVSLFESAGWVLGFGCTTLAVSTIPCDENCTRCMEKDVRLLTFIPCSAKLPVLMFLCGVVLGWGIFGVVGLYILSIGIGLIVSRSSGISIPRFKRITFVDFIKLIIRNIIAFLSRISVGLITAVGILYALQYFGFLRYVVAVFKPLFVPIGLGDDVFITALLFGLIAKEMIVGVVLSFGVGVITITSGIAFVVFALLYTPCISALVAIKEKFGSLFMLKTAWLNFVVAYICAFIVYIITMLVYI